MVEQRSVLAYQSHLGGSGTGVNSQKAVTLIIFKTCLLYTSQSEVLTAEQTVLNLKSEITSEQSSLKETKTSLILMLGWNEGDSVEIGSLPEPDPAAIAGISLETDIEQALENNYDLKILGRQLQNAHSSTTEASVRETLTSGRQAVRANVTMAYQMCIRDSIKGCRDKEARSSP